MSEYIERKALYKALTTAAANDKDKNRRTWAKAICVLHDLPAADVALVVHGRWVSVPYKLARVCSACNRDEPYKFADIDAIDAYVYDYCPNCGAKMDEVSE